MKMFAAVIIACAATLAWTTAPAYAGPGDPIPGVGVGLEGDPEGVAVAKGVTDREGNVTFNNLKPGRYRVVLTDRLKLKVPVRVTITATTTAPMVSEPIAEGQPGSKSYALGKDGRWILTEIGTPSPQVGAAIKARSDSIKVRVESTR